MNTTRQNPRRSDRASSPSTALLLACITGFSAAALAGPVSIPADRDTSMFEESQNSCGAFPHMFAGRTSSMQIRRALLRFDLSAIPAGSTIDSASLKLHLTLTNSFSGQRTMTLHRVLADWGEGTSTGLGEGGTGYPPTPGSATWGFRFYDTAAWSTAGGEFAIAASAETVVDGIGPYEWTSPQLIADVQAWIDGQQENHGWMLRGDEGEFGTAKRFASREHPDETMRPVLIVEFTPPAACYPNCDQSTTAPILNVDDFTCFINNFAAASVLPHEQQVTHYANCDGSTIAPALNVDDFTCFINAFAAGCR